MTLTTQMDNSHHFVKRAQQITAQIPTLLFQRGLVSKFKHWRLVQDPETGMVVLFGVLDNHYITTHTSNQFNDYFEPRLLRDLETELHVPVISSSNDGLRYTFLLKRGESDTNTFKDIPALPSTPQMRTYIRGESVFGANVEAAQGLLCSPMPAIEAHEHFTDDQESSNSVQDELFADTIRHQRLDKFLKTTDLFESEHDAHTQPLPDVLFMDEAEFNQQMAKYEAAQLYKQLAE